MWPDNVNALAFAWAFLYNISIINLALRGYIFCQVYVPFWFNYMPYKDKDKQKEYSKKYSKKYREKYPDYYIKYYQENKDSFKERAKTFYKNNPEKYKQYRLTRLKNDTLQIRAGEKFRKYVKTGKIKREPCEVCGDIKSQGHHEDYSKPLDVIWLCQKHHTIADRARRERLKLEST